MGKIAEGMDVISLRTWMEAKSGNGLRLLKFQLSSFSGRSKERQCRSCGETLTKSLHILECRFQGYWMKDIIESIEDIMIKEDLGHSLLDALKFPQIITN